MSLFPVLLPLLLALVLTMSGAHVCSHGANIRTVNGDTRKHQKQSATLLFDALRGGGLLDEQPQLTIVSAALEEKIRSSAMPLFDVGKDLEAILDAHLQSGSDDDAEPMGRAQARSKAELLCSRYMTRLEEHYLGLYLDGSKRAVGAADREALAQRLLREFSSAAAAALPNAEKYGSWQYIQDGAFSELRADIEEIEKTLAAINASDSTHSSGNSNGVVSRRQRVLRTVRKRAKWLAAQMILFALNAFQSEVNRRMTINSAERRLAEVPEFPLL